MRNIIMYFCFLVAGSNIMSAQNYFSMEGKSVQQDVDFEFDIFVNSDVKVGAFQFDIEFTIGCQVNISNFEFTFTPLQGFFF